MGKPINVYNLGSEGVNVDADDVHVRSGELRSAQNLQIDPAGGLGGVRRRDGLAVLNSSAMAGSVTGIIAVPQPDRSGLTRYFYAPFNDAGASTFRRSSNGTTWSSVTSPSTAALASDLGTFGTGALAGFTGALRWQGFRNKLYYPGHDYTAGTTDPTIHVWDGTTDYTLGNIPPNPNNPSVVAQGVLSIRPYSDHQLIISVYDATSYGRVLLMDVETGAVQSIGQETILSNPPMNFVVWQGKIWAGIVNVNGAAATTVRWARPEDATWTTDLTTGVNNGYVTDLAIFKGNLYIGLSADVGTAGLIRKRTSDGVWSTVYTVDSTDAANFAGPFILKSGDGTIYAFKSGVNNGTPKQAILKSTDGTTWDTEYDIEATLGVGFGNSGMPIRDTNGDIFWPIGTPAKILKRAESGGAWTVVDTPGTALRGPLGMISF